VEFSEIFERVSVVLVMRLLAGSLILFVLSIFASHKIAGPLYRIETAAQAMEKGDLSSDLSKLRAGDELGDLAASLNAAIVKLRQAMEQFKSTANQLAGLTAEAAENKRQGKAGTEDFDKLLGKMEALANKIVTESDRFTT
jgi:methyl-accepting chemotaxis protein